MNRMHAMCVVGLACCFAALGGCDGVAGSQGRLERAEKAIAAGDYGAAMVDIRNALDKAPNGTGDLLTALFAGWLALGKPTNEAAATAVAAVHDVIAATAETGADELALIEAQALLVSPSTIPLVSTLSAAR